MNAAIKENIVMKTNGNFTLSESAVGGSGGKE
jgi:hypothetical protein